MMRLILTPILACISLSLFSAAASPLAPRENAQIHAQALTRRGGPSFTTLNRLFDGTLGTLPALWLVSQGALAGFLSANSTRNERRPKDPATLNIENGGVMASYVARMLTVFVEQYDYSLYSKLCEPIINGETTLAHSVIDPASSKAISNGDLIPDEFEQLVIPGSFLASPLGVIIGTSFSSTLCEAFKRDAASWDTPMDETYPQLDKIPKRRTARDLEDLAVNQGGLLNMQDILADAALSSVGDQAKRMFIARQLRDVFSLVDQHGMLDSFWYINREIVRQLHDLADLASRDRSAFETAGEALKAFRALTEETANDFGIEVTWRQVENDPSFEDFATVVKRVTASLKHASRISELALMVKTLWPQLQVLDWQVRKRIEEQYISAHGWRPGKPLMGPAPDVPRLPVLPPRK